MAAISAGGQKRHTEGFGPLLKGFDQVPFGDHDTIKQFITNQTAGILVEPILGEGGIKVIPEICLKGLREICSERKILLICDEIQSGMGRSGKFFSYEWANIKPDIVTVAKGLGGGFPIGACLTSKKVGEKMTFGSHGSTFGGNPLAVAVANAVLDIVFDKSFLRQVNEVSQYFFAGLEKLKNDSNQILEIRGKGLILGIKFGDETKCEVFVDKARKNGLLIVKAAENVVRLLPPLIISKEQIDHGLKILKTTLEMK
jgi:acetylornithine/N-succinyldiaminopimelate aminotransferase